MKRVFISLLFFSLTISVSAQIQKGFVRTIGRNNHPGTGIADAVISIENPKNGNDSGFEEKEIISDSIGEFEIVFHGYKEGQGFSLKSVTKPGFDLKNYGDIGRHPFSSTERLPIYMYSVKEKIAEERSLVDRYQKKRDSIFRLKEDSLVDALKNAKIEITTYREVVDKMSKDFESTDKLFKIMADRYTTINYDEMSDWEKQIVSFMEYGDFEVADSIVNTIGIEVLFEDAIKAQQRNKTAEQLYNFSTKDAKEKTQIAIEALHVKFTKSIMENNYSLATEYIEKIVLLDTTNLKSLLEASECLSIIGDYSKAKEFAHRAKEKSSSPTLRSKASQLLGISMMGLRDFTIARDCFYDALVTYFDENSLSYSDSCNISNSSFLYALCETELGYFDNINSYLELGLLYIPESEENYDVYGYALISSLEIMITQGYFKEAAQICLLLLSEFDKSESNIFTESNLLIRLFYTIALNGLNRIDESVQCADEMLSLLSTLPEYSYIKMNKNILFNIYSAIGATYSYKQETRNKAYAIMDSVQNVYRTKAVQDVISYSMYLNQMGHLLYCDEQYNKAIDCFKEALQTMQDEGEKNLLIESMLLFNIAQNMIEINQLDTALYYHQKALQIREDMSQDAFFNKVESYDGLGYVYELKEQHLLSHEYYLKAGLAQQEIGGYADMNSIKYMKKSYRQLSKYAAKALTDKEAKYYNQFINNHAFVFVYADENSCETCPGLLYVFELGEWNINNGKDPFQYEWIKYYNNSNNVIVYDGNNYVVPNEINFSNYKLTIIETKEKQKLLRQYNKLLKRRKQM